MAANLVDIVQRLEKVVLHFEGLVGPIGAAGSLPAQPSVPVKPAQQLVSSPAVQAYDSTILSKFTALIETAQKIDPQIVNLTEIIRDAFVFNKSVLEKTSTHKKPSEEEQKSLQSHLSTYVKKIADLKDSRNPLNNFFLYSVEVVQATLWIISPMPAPTAESFIETSSFYGNKILIQKQEHQVAWVKGFNDLVRSNVAFVKEFFTTGLVWNFSGQPFGESSPAPAQAKQEEVKSKKEEVKVQPVKKKEPKKFERGISWIFEHYEGDKTLELAPDETGMKKAVMIDNLVNCVLQIKGKVKNIVISGCKGTSIVCQDVVSGVEIVNCSKMQVQSTGKVPSVSIDKTDGVQLYVTREGYAEMMFSTSKSADMNIVVPGANPDDDYLEIPIPHQYVHRIVNGKITCAPSDLYSH